MKNRGGRPLGHRGGWDLAAVGHPSQRAFPCSPVAGRVFVEDLPGGVAAFGPIDEENGVAARFAWVGVLFLAGCIDVPPPVQLPDGAMSGVDSAVDSGPSDDQGARVDRDAYDDRAADGLPPPDPCAVCPAETFCIDGTCAACEPGTHRGCATDGVRPVCDPETRTCTGCADGDCGGGHCLPDGRCVECDPGAGGCGDPSRPICTASGVCAGCSADAECFAAGRPPICDLDTGVCRLCLEGSHRGCDPTGQLPICDGGQCRACDGAAECGGERLCVDGACVGCNTADNGGCDPTGPEPICVGGVCVPCAGNNQCTDPQRGKCVDGRCRECQPVNHSGCDSAGDRPLCLDGDCVACGDVGGACADRDPTRPICRPDGRCGACDPTTGVGCDHASDTPVCDAVTLTCVGCRRRADCQPDYCDMNTGRCGPCVPDTSIGCEARSETPICQAGACVACRADADCVDNPGGPICNRDGYCGCDDDDECGGVPGSLHCHGAGDCGCHRDDQCIEGFRCADDGYCYPNPM